MNARTFWQRLRTPEGATDLPTSAAGVERAFSLLVIGCQLGTLVQMVPSLPQGVASSPYPAGYLALWLLAAVAACVVSVVVWQQRRPLWTVGFGLDVAVAVVVLLVGMLVVREDLRLGSWMGYQNGYALAVVCTGAGVRSRRVWLAGLAVITVTMAVYLSDAADSENRMTIIGNLLTLVVIGSVARWIANYIRRVAADGDAARAEALELGRRAEERRAQLAIHNGAAVIRMLGDPSLDERARALLQEEAQREAARMRSYLQGQSSRTSRMPSGPVTLPLAVEGVCGRFADLPIHATLDLAEDVALDPSAAQALDHALASVLLNIRDHADADTVVIHADSDHESDSASGGDAPWSLTVHDDGVGFSPAPAQFGVGLREVVVGQLAAHDMDVDVSSTPGLGTTITITGRSTP